MCTCAGGDVLVHGCVRVVARSAAAVGVYGERGRALDVEALLVKRSWCLRLCVRHCVSHRLALCVVECACLFTRTVGEMCVW